MAHPSPHAGALLALQRVEPFEHRGIALATDAVDADGRLRGTFAAGGDNRSPAIGWSRVLEAQAYAMVVEDPDAPGDRPFLHWLIWDIPGQATEIPQGVHPTVHPGEIPGATQGRNAVGHIGWYGPHPPVGHGVHHYHFQLFALSKRLDGLSPDIGLDEFVNALKGVTIASGEFVATFERPDPALDAPSPARTGGYGENPHLETRRDEAAGRGGLDRDDRDRHAPHRPDGGVIPRSP